jgi:hypothetical protein
MNLTKYQPRNQDEQAIIESRPNRIANIEPKDAFRNVLNVISNIFPLHGIWKRRPGRQGKNCMLTFLLC